MFYLLDACTQYIDYCHTLEGVKFANPKIYELCFLYCVGKTTKKQDILLAGYFKLT
jgi:hypothetical protein